MSWTFCTSGAAITKAGLYANSDIVASGSVLANWSNEVESIICDVARVDLITNYATLTASGKEILQSISSSHIGQKIIIYDLSGYTTLAEAQTILDVLDNDVVKGLSLIEGDKVKTYLSAT